MAAGRLDELGTRELIEWLDVANEQAVAAVRGAAPAIAAAVDAIVDGWCRGGRLIYAGAGTSGRLGVLDAAECPPTFGTEPGRVDAVLAGGATAMLRAVEGAEDDGEAGAAEADRLGAAPPDVWVGLSASGTTPFTVGVVRRAGERGATTVAVSATRASPLVRAAALPIVVDVGAELVDGSTRLKAGSAQKMVCNALSTAAMIRLGRVRGRSMVGVQPTNRKLRERALAILREQAGLEREDARRALDEAAGDLPTAVVMAEGDVTVEQARELLREAGGSVPEALAQLRVSGRAR